MTDTEKKLITEKLKNRSGKFIAVINKEISLIKKSGSSINVLGSIKNNAIDAKESVLIELDGIRSKLVMI